MLPELSLSALPRHIWTGVKAGLAVAALFVVSYRGVPPSLDKQTMALIASGKKVIPDPATTGSIPKPVKPRSAYFGPR